MSHNIYHLHVPIVLKSGSLNILESSGPPQVSNGVAYTRALEQILGYLILHKIRGVPLNIFLFTRFRKIAKSN